MNVRKQISTASDKQTADEQPGDEQWADDEQIIADGQAIADNQIIADGQIVADNQTLEIPAAAQEPSKHSPIWKDMFRVSLVFIGGYVLMQLVVSAILEVVIFSLDSQIQNYITDRTNAGQSLTSVITDPEAVQFFAQRLSSYGMLMTIVGDLAVIALFLTIRKKKLVTTDITTTQPVNNRWFELGAALVFIFGIQLVLSFVDELISLSGYNPSSVQSNLFGTSMSSFTGFLSIVIIVPFLEEWIFRGAIMRSLVPYGVNFAIVTQALFFAFWHSNLYQGIFAFMVGLVLGYVAFHFSLKWSYALHAASNGMAFLMGASWMPVWVAWAFFALAFVASVAIVVYFRQVVPIVVSEGAPQIEHPFQQGWKNWAFITVAVIMVAISCVMMVLMGS